MSKQVQKALLSFYLTKKYQNRTLTSSQFREAFKGIPCWSFTTIQSPVFLDYKMIKEGLFQIGEISLVTRDSFYRLFPTIAYRACLIGTNVIPISNDIIPWWKLKKYGSKSSEIFDDILPEHINKKLKYREDVLNYLSFLKNSLFSQEQLTLPGFE